MIRTSIPSWLVAIASITTGANAFGATYQVGPSKPFHQISEVASRLKPGDIVEVDGDATYSSVSLSKNGTAEAKITIRGMLRNGKRPAIKGGTNTIGVHGSHYVFEGLDVSGGTSRCIFHHADDVTVRNTVVHDCPAHGILGADNGSGSLTLEQVEVYRSGQGDRKHQIYIATDEEMYPDAVFRMQHSYVHDGNGGNNVKTRAGRNEIYYNWIEGAMYHELELIGPEAFDTGVLREDSDVVGNIIRKTRGANVIRIGGDGSGYTNGRYRFVNNTIIVHSTTKNVFRLFDGLESVEMHNNVFAGMPASSWTMMRDTEARWAKGHPIIGGSNNWVPTGLKTPTQWTNTRSGSDPGFANAAGFDYSPAQGSALRNAGNEMPMSPAEAPIPNPLAMPLYAAPARKIEAPRMRGDDGAIDIGALEAGMGKQAFSLEDQAQDDEEEGEVQEIEQALMDAGASWDGLTCSMNPGSSRNPALASVFASLAAVVAIRRRKRAQR
jgi:hypothetical protein